MSWEGFVESRQDYLAIAVRDAEYIMDVIRLDIGIEITHEHRATVSTCILL